MCSAIPAQSWDGLSGAPPRGSVALALSEVLLTLDRAAFGALLGGTFYGLPILTLGMFLERERVAGRLRE